MGAYALCSESSDLLMCALSVWHPQIVCALGIIIQISMPTTSAPWLHTLNYTLVLLGSFSTRVWTAVIAVSVSMLRVRGLCFLLRWRCSLYVVGFR